MTETISSGTNSSWPPHRRAVEVEVHEESEKILSTTSSKSQDVTNPIRKGSLVNGSGSTVAPFKSPRWMQWCYYVHALFCVFSVLAMFRAGSLFTKERSNDFPTIIQPPRDILGLMGSLGVDASDRQWRQFSSYIVSFLPPLLLFLFVSLKVRQYGQTPLFVFHALAGLALGTAMHAYCFVIPLTVILLNYAFMRMCICFRVSYIVFMTTMWVSLVTLLLASQLMDRHEIALMDENTWGGFIRWGSVFNVCILRMIAFNMDYYWAVHDGSSQHERAVRKHDTLCLECALMREACNATDEQTRCYKFRTECPRPLNEYNMLSYMAYMFYVPLYIAGPMSSFNAFASHCRYATQAMPWRLKLFYALRILGIYVLLVTMLHFLYVNAFRVAPYLLVLADSFTSLSLVYLHLPFLWMKFACIWRLFRLLAILDGVDSPEDMEFCFMNTVSVQLFWRNWHASFNLWIVRYMYIPMGGNRKKYLIIFPIFMFIAIWHDAALHLIHWALCMCFGMIVELAFFGLVRSHSSVSLLRQRYPSLYAVLRGVFSAVALATLIFACCVGFTAQQVHRLESSSTPDTLYNAIRNSSWVVFLWMCAFLYCSTQVSLASRDAKAEILRVNRRRLLNTD